MGRIGVQLLVGVIAAAAAAAARLAIEPFAPAVAPFALHYPAMLLATVLAGGRAGIAAALTSGVISWYAIVPPVGSFAIADRAGAVTLVLYACAASLLIAMAAAFRNMALKELSAGERLTAERERLLQEQQMLFANTRGFMAVLRGPDYLFEFANDAYREMIGRRRVVGLSLREVLPESAQAICERLDEVRRTGKPFVGHAIAAPVHPRGGGLSEERFLDVVYNPLRNHSGEIDRIMVEGVDVTDAVRSQAALRESQERLDLATSAAMVGVWEWRLPTNEMIYSEEARQICGFDLTGPVTLEMARGVTHPDDLPRTSAQAQRALDPAIRDTAPYEYRIVRPDGQERWIYAVGRAIFEGPVATRYVGTLQDITERKHAEQRLLDSEARLRLAVEAGRMAVWRVMDDQLEHSPELNEMLGFPREARPTIDEMAEGYLPGERDRIRAAAGAALSRGERFFEAEYRYRRRDGQVRWLLLRAELVGEPGGAPRGAVGVLMDVTERKRDEERLRLLAREVDHRANNLMAVVQGIVALSRAEDARSLKAVLTGRVNALARAHQLLAETRWEGADLRRLVEEELLAFTLGDAGRVRLDGGPVALPPAAAQGLAMALHELTTNAAKYGALSVPSGRVKIAWSQGRDGRVLITWRESGGPPVAAPTRRGLGTTMLQRALGGPLKGAARLDWRVEGLVCELELPGDVLEAGLLAAS